jgi:hypothetical protein
LSLFFILSSLTLRSFSSPSIKMSHSSDVPEGRRSFRKTLALGEDSDDDDDDAASYSTPEDIASPRWTRLTRKKPQENCMRIYCSVAKPTEYRVCACLGSTCGRLNPTSHKNAPDAPQTHASNGWFLAFPARKGSKRQDGDLASFRTDAQRQEDWQRLSDQNIAAALALQEESPEHGRNFHDEEEEDPDDGPLMTPRGSVTFAATTPTDSLGSTRTSSRYKTPPLQAGRTAARDIDATSMAGQLATFSQLLSDTLVETRAYSARVEEALSTGIIGAASGNDDATGNDDGPQERQGQSSRPKKGRGSTKTMSGKAKGKKKKGKKSSLWYGVVSGQTGSLHRSESEARARVRELTPFGRMSAAFAFMEDAQAWIGDNLDDPLSSDTDGNTNEDSSDKDAPAAVPRTARVQSNVVPPHPVAAADARLFDFITRDTSRSKLRNPSSALPCALRPKGKLQLKAS